MSLVYKVVEEFVDDLLDRAKEAVDGYAKNLQNDFEAFLEKVLRRALKRLAIGIFGAAVFAAGAVFALIGVVDFLSPVLGPGGAWGLVGLVSMAVGAVALYVPFRRSLQTTRPSHRGRGLNGGD